MSKSRLVCNLGMDDFFTLPDSGKIWRKKGGEDHVHPHKFRRTLATDLTRHGMPIQEVARILGHDKLDTTMKYVVLNKDDIKASYRRYA